MGEVFTSALRCRDCGWQGEYGRQAVTKDDDGQVVGMHVVCPDCSSRSIVPVFNTKGGKHQGGGIVYG